LIKRIIISLLFGSTLIFGAAGEEKVCLKGHVLAAIDSPFFESGTSYRYQQFVFGIESKDSQGKRSVTPVLITYSASSAFLPKGFFDYEKVYELHVLRKIYGDTSLESIAYIKYVDADSKKETAPPMQLLRLLDGVPKDILRMDMVLANYELLPGDYKIVKE
jgi:hypothetical protein